MPIFRLAAELLKRGRLTFQEVIDLCPEVASAGSVFLAWQQQTETYVSAGAKIGTIPVEKSATLGGREPGLILDSEEGRMCPGGATWKRLLS